FDRPGFTFPAPNWSLGRIDIYGQLTTYSLGFNDNVTGLVSGGDGNLWFIDLTKNQVVKFSLVTKAVAGTFAIPSASNQNGDNQTILAWDGNVWFTRGTALDRITPDGTITEFHVPSGGQPAALLMSGDNTIWFTEPSSGKLGQLVLSSVTPGGSATINESSANLSDVVQLFLLPPAFAGSSGAHKLGIVPNANCTETKMAFSSLTGKWEMVTVQLPEPCADIAAVGVIAKADPLGAAAIVIGGTVGSFS